MDLEKIKSLIREIPDFPKPGIKFKDITPILKDPSAFEYVVEKMAERFKDKNITKVASAESRGFILGSGIALKLKAGFVPLRKPGKLPYKTIKEEYELEYGKDAFEVHVDGIEDGDRVLLVDDVVATGGTIKAAANLVERLGGKVEGIALLIALKELGGLEKIKDYDTFTLLEL